MQVPILNRSAIILITIMFCQSISAQQITAADKNAAIQAIAKHIAANYIYPEKGGQIASHIQMANFKGTFEKATTWKEFDEMVTDELKDFSKDGHLFVRHNPEVAKELNNPSSTQDEKKGLLTNTGKSSGNVAISESKILEGNVGYLKLPEINITRNNLEGLYDGMKKVEGTKALIIDLRDNGGGGSEVGPVLESYFLPEGTPTLRFTKRDGNYTTDSTVNWLKEKKYDKPVFILVNKNTASAAEAFAFVLQQNRRAKIVGEKSAGAAYMNSWYAVNDENFVSVSTAAPTIPGKDISWELSGIQPDIKVKKGDALEVALKEASKA